MGGPLPERGLSDLRKALSRSLGRGGPAPGTVVTAVTLSPHSPSVCFRGPLLTHAHDRCSSKHLVPASHAGEAAHQPPGTGGCSPAPAGLAAVLHPPLRGQISASCHLTSRHPVPTVPGSGTQPGKALQPRAHRRGGGLGNNRRRIN